MQKPIGVVVAQLGTPDAPTAKALRPYLRQFLSDMRVIDYSPFIWQPILRGIILNTRPRKSARLYQRVWLDEGSPLLVYTQKQAEGLQARLDDSFRVVVGMTYGNPSIKDAIRGLEEEGIDRIVVLSMFPQYASTTTASIYDTAYTAAAGRRCPLFRERKRFIPTLRFVPPYYDHPGYITALAERVQAAVAANGEPEHYVFSFHGNPARYTTTGDPYRDQCAETARLLAEYLSLPDERWTLSFQSQFGPEDWLQPYTEDVLEELGEKGTESVLVTCPGFIADCLETLDEIDNEGREMFEEAGGGHFIYAPCLNDHAGFLDTLAEIVLRESAGWVEPVRVSASLAE